MSALEHDLNIVYVDPEQLRHWPGNARRGQVELIRQSMEQNGVFAPLTVQASTNRIIIGNHRFMALQELWKAEPQRWPRRVPVVFLDVDDARAQRINLDDNKTSDESQWDNRLLLDQLTGLYEDDLGTLTGSGFTDAEYTQLLLDQQPPQDPPAGPDLKNGAGVQLGSEPGDVAPLGDNTKHTPAPPRDYRALVYFDSESDRDDAVAVWRAEGYNASAVG